MMSSSVNSLIFNFLEVRINSITEGWLTRRPIDHMDMAEQLIQIIHGSMMDNSKMEYHMDILDVSSKMVTIRLKNGQMVIE